MTASYLLKRLLLMIYTLLVVSLLVFGITQLLALVKPGVAGQFWCVDAQWP